MKKIVALSAISALFWVQACTGGEQKPNASATADSTSAKKTVQGRIQQIKDSLNSIQGSDASAVRFLETDARYSYWGALVKKSKWAKDIHNGNYTVLGVPNEAMLRYGEEMLGELKADENQAILDELVGRHVISTPFTAQKAEGLTQLETIGGKKLNIQPGAQQIEGIVYSLDQIGTQHGSVVVIKELINFPEAELVKQQKKRAGK